MCRYHSEEGEVKLSISKSNKKRKILLDSIRRQGHYVRKKSQTITRPVIRPPYTEKIPDLKNGMYLPCNYCS